MLAKCEIRGVFPEWQVVEECIGISLSFGQFAYSLIDLYIKGSGMFLLERISVY